MTGFWNYRVMKKNGVYGFVEAYYGEGGLHSWTDFIWPSGESPAELGKNMGIMMRAFLEPVINEHGKEIEQTEVDKDEADCAAYSIGVFNRWWEEHSQYMDKSGSPANPGVDEAGGAGGE